jgi:hypothetical protein
MTHNLGRAPQLDIQQSSALANTLVSAIFVIPSTLGAIAFLVILLNHAMPLLGWIVLTCCILWHFLLRPTPQPAPTEDRLNGWTP